MTDEEAAPGTLAAVAEELRAETAAHRALEGEQRGNAEAVLDDARERAAAIMSAAEDQARGMTAAADLAAAAAGVLEKRATWAEAAAQSAQAAEEAEARVAALEAERDGLAAQVADLGVQFANLQAERGDVGVQLAAALEAGDLDAVTACRGRLSAIEELSASLAGRQGPLRARVDAIGTGEFLGQPRPLELYRAQTEAGHHRRSMRRSLNLLFPDRAEAEADRRRAEYLDWLQPRASDSPPSGAILMPSR